MGTSEAAFKSIKGLLFYLIGLKFEVHDGAVWSGGENLHGELKFVVGEGGSGAVSNEQVQLPSGIPQ